MPLAVTVLPLPTAASAKLAAAALQVTPAGLPESVQLVIVAVAVPSYALLAAVTEAVTGTGAAAVMLAVVVAVVLVRA